MGANGFPKFRNDNAAREIHIGAREFECIGVTPPHDHPHVYLDMGEKDSIYCPYCVTTYRFDSDLDPTEADPPECAYRENPTTLA